MWHELFHFILLPPDTQHLIIYYLFWLLLFVIVNVVWDIYTTKTAPFHLECLKEKIPVLTEASSFCSSLLIITGLISPAVQQLSRDTTIPLLLAGCSGLLRTVPALCPYKPAPSKLANLIATSDE